MKTDPRDDDGAPQAPQSSQLAAALALYMDQRVHGVAFVTRDGRRIDPARVSPADVRDADRRKEQEGE